LAYFLYLFSPNYRGEAMAIYIMGLAVLTNSTLPLRNASYIFSIVKLSLIPACLHDVAVFLV
jgi:hypothetical protein